jgi:predicted phage terminase large subunit-like protein
MEATSPTATDRELAEYERRTRPLGQFIEETSPPFVEPKWLGELVALFARIRDGEIVRSVLSIPPRHTKSETVLHAFPWLLDHDPTWTIGYASYAADFAATKCARAKKIARRAGVRLSGRDREDYWETPEGGLVRSDGITGQWAGGGYRLIVVDDPIKNREEAESPRMRDKTYEAFTSDLLTRQDPRGTSVLVVHTRWHPDDLGGRLIQRGWPCIHKPAINLRGEALWPEVFPVSRLEEIKRDLTTYEWESLYQGTPIPRGGAVFGPTTWCRRSELPQGSYQVAAGYDLAYSGKTHSDYSVCLVLLRSPDGTVYVVDVLRVQKQAPEFCEAAALRLRGGWKPTAGRWYTSTTERGLADLMAQLGLPITPVLASADKFVRAQPVAAAWQQGRVRVLADQPWSRDFALEVERFTGLGDQHDDQVDALAAAFDELDGEGRALADYRAMIRSSGRPALARVR